MGLTAHALFYCLAHTRNKLDQIRDTRKTAKSDKRRKKKIQNQIKETSYLIL